MLSRFPSSKEQASFNFMAAVTTCSDLGAQESKVCHYFHSYLPWSDGSGCNELCFLDVELDHKESWVQKNWCLRTVVLEKTLESPLDCKEIKPVNPNGKQSWIFTGRTDAKAEVAILWPPDARSWLTGEAGVRGRDGWMASLTQRTWVWASSRRCEGQGSLWATVLGVAKSRTQLSDWTAAAFVENLK